MGRPPSRRGEDEQGSGYIGTFDPNYKHGQEVHGDVRISAPLSEDAFKKLIVDNTRNALDLPSTYDASPERKRVAIDGVRQTTFNLAQFSNNEVDFTLSPAAGERATFYTAERPRYVVGYESLASMAMAIDSTLSGNDTVRIGVADNEFIEQGTTGSEANGVFFEWTASGQRTVMVNDGTEVASESWEYPTDQDTGEQILDNSVFQRLSIQYNWYNVGRWLFDLAYTDGSLDIGERQLLKEVSELTVDDGQATSEVNFHIFYEADADANESGITMRAGSVAYQTLGDIDPVRRIKAVRITELDYSGSGEYEPVYAIRIDPERDNTFVNFSTLETIINNGSGEMLCIAVDQNLTDADFVTDPTGDGVTTGPVYPRQTNPDNNVIQFTTDVTTFPDEDDNLVTTADDPGGYQVAFAASDSLGGVSRSGSGSRRVRPIYDDDVVVFLVRRDTAQTAEFKAIFTTEQEW